MIALTTVQKKLLSFIEAEIASNGEAPTIAAMAMFLEVSATAARGTLLRLERKGYVKRTTHIQRGLELAARERD